MFSPKELYIVFVLLSELKAVKGDYFYLSFSVFVTKKSSQTAFVFVSIDQYINISVVFMKREWKVDLLVCCCFVMVFLVVVNEEEEELQQGAPLSCDSQSAVLLSARNIYLDGQTVKGVIQVFSSESGGDGESDVKAAFSNGWMYFEFVPISWDKGQMFWNAFYSKIMTPNFLARF